MVESIKDLERLLKLARKQGVTEISIPNVSFKLGDLPVKHPDQSIEDQSDDFEVNLNEPLTAEEYAILANGGDLNAN